MDRRRVFCGELPSAAATLLVYGLQVGASVAMGTEWDIALQAVVVAAFIGVVYALLASRECERSRG